MQNQNANSTELCCVLLIWFTRSRTTKPRCAHTLSLSWNQNKPEKPKTHTQIPNRERINVFCWDKSSVNNPANRKITVFYLQLSSRLSMIDLNFQDCVVLTQFCTTHSIPDISFCIPRNLKLVRVMKTVLEIDLFFLFSWFPLLSEKGTFCFLILYVCFARTRKVFVSEWGKQITAGNFERYV